MFLIFKKASKKEWVMVRIFSWGITLAALVLYALTVSRSAFPGASAQWIAWVAGADVRDVVTHPLLSKFGGWVAALPFGTLAVRLNLLSAVAGALIVGWVCHITHFIAHEWIREESALVYSKRVARFAGFIAAIAVAFSLPFWQAATQFRPEIFDTALMVGCLNLLVIYAYTENYAFLFLFGILTGIGFVESANLTLAVPFLWGLAVIFEWKLAWCRMWPLVTAFSLSLLCAFGMYLYAGSLTFDAEKIGIGFSSLLPTVIPVLREQWGAIGKILTMRLWLPVLLLGYGTALVCCFAANHMLDNRRKWNVFLLALVLSGAEIMLLLELPFTPSDVVMARGIIPSSIYAVAGIGFGLLLASWFMYFLVEKPFNPIFGQGEGEKTEDEKEEEDNLDAEIAVPRRSLIVWKITHMAAYVMLPAFFLILLISIGLHAKRLLGESVAFADKAAVETLERLGKRRWVVPNGFIDSHLLTAAHERRQELHLLCPYRLHEKRYLDRTKKALLNDPVFSRDTKLRAQNMMEVNFYLFLEDFFAGDPDMGGKVVSFGLPDLWYSASWTPVPDCFFFAGVRDLKTFSAKPAFSEARAFWTRWKPFFEEKDGDERQLSYMTRVLLRRHLAMLANNLGVVMDDCRQPAYAYLCYRQTLEMVPEHISALLNLFDLVVRGVHPEDKDWVENSLKKKVNNPRERYPLWALSRYYGYVRNYEIFVRMGWNWALSSSPESVLAGLRSTYAMEPDKEKRAALSSLMAPLYAMHGDFKESAEEYKKTLAANPASDFAVSGLSRLALQRNEIEEARKILNKGEASGVAKRSLRMDWAALSLAAGDLPRARVLLEQVCDEPEPPLTALGMLAMVMLEQKDKVPVERKVLPAMIQRVGGTENYLVQVVLGRIAQRKEGKEAMNNARACYLRALAIRPDVQSLLKTILNLDVLLRDKTNAISHALALLRYNPSEPYANCVIGSIRLEDGEYGDSEEYLRKSCANEKTATLFALNNYAQVLCRIKKLTEAEKISRQAVKKDPKRYEVWSTLAYVLAQEGKLDEATAAINKAWELDAKDVRLYLTEALIAIKRNDATTAKKAMDAIGDLSSFEIADRREAENLRALIAQMKP